VLEKPLEHQCSATTTSPGPGNKEIQLSILYNAKRNLDVYADWQEYFRKQQPPMLITWGKNDGIFTVEGAELFKRDIPSAELDLLDTGHFALEEEVDRIGSLMHEFLGRTIKRFRTPSRRTGAGMGNTLNFSI
jgi:pimeloyl-ACP methyl ester carboxylesterase